MFFILPYTFLYKTQLNWTLGLLFLKFSWFLELLFLICSYYSPIPFKNFHNTVMIYTRSRSNDTAESQKEK